MNIITVNFKPGESIPAPGDVFNTRNPDAPGGIIKAQVVAILRVHWYGKQRWPKATPKPEGVSVVMAANVEDVVGNIEGEG